MYVTYATTLEKRIRKFCKKFGIKTAFATEQFSYLPEKEVVTFTVLKYSEDDKLIKYINEKYNTDIGPWYFVFCLLHEIGHHMTLSNLSDEEYAFEQLMRKEVLNIIEVPNEIYFTLPAEVMATEWALKYIMNHAQECWDFQRKCHAIMKHIVNKKSFHY